MDIARMQSDAKQKRDEVVNLRSQANDLNQKADQKEKEAMKLETDTEQEAKRLLTSIQNQRDS